MNNEETIIAGRGFGKTVASLSAVLKELGFELKFMKTITADEYRRLQVLREMVSKLRAVEDVLCAEAELITGEETGNWTFDYIHNNYLTTEEMLERLDIQVEPSS